MRKVRYEVGRRAELTPDVGRVAAIGDDGGQCILALHGGRCHAVGSLCPHQNATLDGAAIENGQIICKRHGYRFDLKTGDCRTVGGYGLPTFPVTEEDGKIFVDVWEYEDQTGS